MSKKKVKKKAKKAREEAGRELERKANEKVEELEAGKPKLESLRIKPEDRHLLDDFPGPKPKPPKKKTAYSGMDPPIPPPELLDLVHNFLKDFKYIKAAHGLRTDNQKRPGHNMTIWKWKADGFPLLLDIFLQYRKQNPDVGPRAHILGEIPEGSNPDEKNVLGIEEASDDEQAASFELSSDLESTSSLKRKFTSSEDSESGSSFESSLSSASSISSDSEDDEPAAKKIKVESSLHRSSKPDTQPNHGKTTTPNLSSGSSVSASNDVSSHSDSSAEESSSSDDYSSDDGEVEGQSDDSSTANPGSSRLVRRNSEDRKARTDSSDSSTTLVGTVLPPKTLTVDGPVDVQSSTSSSSSSSSSSAGDSGVDDVVVVAKKTLEVFEISRPGKRKHAESEDATQLVPATKDNEKRLKRENIPFSRIPVDIVVDEKFKSNKYVPYDYAEKAHQDLIVTKGKGFTKEKNKKKRGQRFSGGMIDIQGSRAVKFDD